ncbi:MAG: response regulator [Syntrophales bacterium]
MAEKPLRVLIVEDSQDDALLLIRELQRAGYEPRHDRVQTALAMLSALQKNSWDLILSGCRFRDFNCLQAIELFKETGIDIPFIIVSRAISEEMATEAMKAGAHDCVKNRRRRLIPTIERELRAAVMRREHKRIEAELHRNQAIVEELATEMSIIAEIGRLISSTLDIDEVYERFAAEARKLIPFDRLVVNLNKPQENVHYCAYVSGMVVPGRKPGDSFSLASSVNEMLVRMRKGMIIQPSAIEEIADRYPSLVSTFDAGVRSMMSVPLISRDEVIGGLHFRMKRPNAYTAEMLRLAERIGAQIAGAIANAQLFADLKKTGSSLRESEGRFRALVEQAAVGVSETDIFTGRYITVNRRFCEMVGRTEEEMLATTFLAITHPDDLHLHEEKTALLLAGKIGYYSLEKRYIRKDGGIVWADVTVSPLWKPGEVPGRNIAVALDITERKRLEEERLKLEERLRRAEKMEALGQLAGGVAHDLNNVLGVLVGYSELLVEKIPKENPLRRYAFNIQKSSEKGAAIIQDLLTLARRGVAVSEIVNLNRVVADYLETPEFENLKIYHPSVNFTTAFEKELLNIQGSPVHLSKTLMNLVANAAEAISGGGEVTVRTENRYLDLPILGYDDMREGDYVILTVSDTGRGISSADLDKIFEPFYTKKVMGRSGTGLGLAVVWGTVKDHHGYIDVRSEEGKGSAFTLYFPVVRQEVTSGEGEAAVSAETYRGRGETILVVDDVKEQQELAISMLTRLGYRVNAVSGGEEALDYLKMNRIDLVVLDMIMDPGIDGLETYRRILEIHPRQKAVIVSGFSETDRVREAQALGAGAYVRKPYVLEKIGLAIRRELDR